MHRSFYIFGAFSMALAACSDASEDDYAVAETGLIGEDGISFSDAQAHQPQQATQAAPQQYAQAQAQQPTQQSHGRAPDGLQPAQIIDRNGFGQPVVAGTMMIPAGWKTQGGVVWSQNMTGCGPNTPHINWTATSPDGLSVIQVLPEEKWSGHNMPTPAGMSPPPCPNVQTTDPRQYITQYVQRVRPNARLIDYRERNDIVEGVTKMMPQQPEMYGMETRQWVAAGDALLAYNMQGREMREIIGVAAIFNMTKMSDGMGGVTEMLNIFSVPGFAYRAPEGQLDFKEAAVIRDSYRTDPQWSARMAGHNAKMSGIAAKGARDRAEITSRTNSEISDMQMDSWRKQQAASDRGQREFNEYIGDYETYNDPSTGDTVQLDSGYDRNFQLEDGSYVQTNDQFYDPYADSGQDATELEPTP